jgi:hypothetical protein
MATAIYERIHPAHAWHYVRTTNREAAELARGVNIGFGVETLLLEVPNGEAIHEWLDATSTPE